MTTNDPIKADAREGVGVPASPSDSVVERMRGKLDPYLFSLLLPSFQDADYNREYEQKGLSAWESPEYRPYCLNCSTMRRMEHRDYGYQCSVCGNKCGPQGKALNASGTDRPNDTTEAP